MRRRLGELGLTFTVVTVPHARPERKQVLEVSGQVLVPTLVTGDGQVFVDENDILAWLDERQPRPAPKGLPWPEGAEEELGALGRRLKDDAARLFELSDAAASSGDRDRENVIHVAAENLREAARWLGARD